MPNHANISLARKKKLFNLPHSPKRLFVNNRFLHFFEFVKFLFKSSKLSEAHKHQGLHRAEYLSIANTKEHNAKLQAKLQQNHINCNAHLPGTKQDVT